MNNITILGRLTKDLELKETKNGKPYVFFTVASRNYADNTAFIPCIAYDRNASILEKYASKGSRICVKGYVETVKKENERDRNIVRVDALELADSKGAESSTDPIETENEAKFYEVEDLGEMELPF